MAAASSFTKLTKLFAALSAASIKTTSDVLAARPIDADASPNVIAGHLGKRWRAGNLRRSYLYLRFSPCRAQFGCPNYIIGASHHSQAKTKQKALCALRKLLRYFESHPILQACALQLEKSFVIFFELLISTHSVRLDMQVYSFVCRAEFLDLVHLFLLVVVSCNFILPSLLIP